MTNVIRIQFFLSLCAVAVARGQQAVPIQPPDVVIHGHGAKRSLAKFTGTNSIDDSRIVEAGGNLRAPRDNIAAKAVPVTTINRALGTATQGTNNTTRISTDRDAAFARGIGGLVCTTNSHAGIGLAGVSNATDGNPIRVFGH
jgi:hypothetical protein